MKARFVTSVLVTIIDEVDVPDGADPYKVIDERADAAIQNADALFEFIENAAGEIALVHNTTLMHTE